MSATDKYDIVGGKKTEGRTMRISLALQEAALLSLHYTVEWPYPMYKWAEGEFVPNLLSVSPKPDYSHSFLGGRRRQQKVLGA